MDYWLEDLGVTKINTQMEVTRRHIHIASFLCDIIWVLLLLLQGQISQTFHKFWVCF